MLPNRMLSLNILQKIDIPGMIAECTDKWFNQTLARVNESVVRIGIVEGAYHWHKHDNDDEFLCSAGTAFDRPGRPNH